LDWGKNSGFVNHGALFRSEDLGEVPYFYAADVDDPEHLNLPLIQKTPDFSYRLITEIKEGYSAPLYIVADRLLLLGYTEEYCRNELETMRDLECGNHDFSFDELKGIFGTADFSEAAFQPQLGSESIVEFLIRRVLPRLGTTTRLHYKSLEDNELDGLSAYSILRLLADNPSARLLPVTWQFSDVADGGWAPREHFLPFLPQERRFLIVTEGSSDVRIIKHALSLLKPELADFFDFVDMQENYPFSGTGNLYNFVRGLISIKIQNNIIIVFDNDAEGVFNWERSVKLNRPENMRIVKLPDRESFRNFRTVGPTGEYRFDINGRAAAIECYLNLADSPLVRWTNYDHHRDCYQGHIVNKEQLAQKFLLQRALVPGYDYSGLEAILDMLITESKSLGEAVCRASLDADLVRRG